MNIDWHLLPLSEVSELDTSPQVLMKTRLINGNGTVKQDYKKRTLFYGWFHQLSNFMILILIVGYASRFLGGITDTVIILIIIIVNAVIGFVQEYRAEKAMEALKDVIPDETRVLRAKTIAIATDELVPGDVVLLEAGNRIPADVRFIETHQLKVDESTLTGESNTIDKRQRNYPLSIPLRLQQFRIQRHFYHRTRKRLCHVAMERNLVTLHR
jgi:Ca2+-transporting ATPase